MLDPRIYRTGFVAVALAVVVVAFSLVDQQGPVGASLAPEAFSGQSAYATMTALARGNPQRRPGSTGDADVASYVANRLRQYGYGVSTHVFTGRTVDGKRTLETVTGIRTGSSNSSIVVLSHRDSTGAPATAALSGTAALLELARALAGETQHRSVVLVSTSGSAGLAGATEVARRLAGPVDAVIALGDLAGTHVHEPVVVPWSEGTGVAPPMLRNTVAAALGAQTGFRPGGASLGGQLAHLAFPLTLGEQGPFGARGIPAVTLSLAADHPIPAAEPTSPDQLNATGRAVLQTINALDGGARVPPASPYLLYSGKVVPAWAVKLLVAVLLLPVLLAVIDGFARVRRRGHSVTAGLRWVLALSLPFVLGTLLLVAARLVGFISAVPPGPVAAGAVPLDGSGVALIAVTVLVLVLAFFVLTRLARSSERRPAPSSGTTAPNASPGPSARHPAPVTDPGRSIAVLIVMCAVTVAIWLVNPFAAILVVPALHLWMWVVDPELRPPRPLIALLLLVGLAPPVLVVLYYVSVLGLGPLGVIWNGLLLIAGGHVGLASAVEWSLVLGCAVSVFTIAARSLREPRPEEAPVTVRGPITYAGPGSLGGTESALRR